MSIVDVSGLSIDELLGREWLATNQIGGYACSTAVGLNTRKYHGLLVASMAPPVRRMVLLSRVEETLLIGNDCDETKPNQIPLSCCEYPGTIHPRGDQHLLAFSSSPFPRWLYQVDGGVAVEKTLRLVRGENTVVLSYTRIGGASSTQSVALELRPLMALRGMHDLSYQWNGRLEAQNRTEQHHRIPPTSKTPEVFFAHDGEFEADGCWYTSTIYRRESERGYAGLEDLWMPGVIRWALAPGQSVHFVCSTDPIELERTLAEADRQMAQVTAPVVASAATDSNLDALLRAADQFVVSSSDKTRTSPGRSINLMTQYPWSAPSARDALIGFAGLLLVPKRFHEAKVLLESLAEQTRDGQTPTEFQEDGSDPKAQGADTALWLINAVHQYLRYSGDQAGVRERLFESVLRIVRSYQAGIPAMGVTMDADGLLCSHLPGTATSWMNAKVGDWVITPRQGRTVELNALWYNAVRIAADLCERFDRKVWAAEMLRLAESIHHAFDRRFWNELAGCCFDVVTDRGADPSIRPNQIFAASLPYSVLSMHRHAAVVQKVREMLLTPMGVRTLAPSDPSYQGHYRGDVVQRDRAYHQGSAYPWLLAALADATVKTQHRSHASRSDARELLEGCLRHLKTTGLGQLPELFDGDAPHRPGGAIASARSVGEVLRAYVEDVLGFEPRSQLTETVRTRAEEQAPSPHPRVGA